MILLSPSKEVSKNAIFSRQKAFFQKEAETLDPSIQGLETYEAYSLYNGLAFRKLKEEGFTLEEIDFMEKNLRILSALYGVLRPKDGIVEHRLDFTAKGLYAFWQNKIYQALKKELKKDEYIINLASDEFSKTITRYLEEEDLFLQIDFYQKKKEGLKKHSTISKKGRGAMARYLIKNQKINMEVLQSFQEEGFLFSEEQSTKNKFVFIKE